MIMLYHHASLTGLALVALWAWPRQSVRQAVYHHLESPGTKCFFSEAEIR